MKGETIFCISTRSWDSPWSESQKVMSLMQEANVVYFFNPGRSVHNSVVKEFVRNFPNFFRLKVEQKAPNLFVVHTPSNLPFGLRHFGRTALKWIMPMIIRLNTKILARHMRWVKKKYDIRREILWIFSPYLYLLPGKFHEKLSCYHNYDEFSDFVGFSHMSDFIDQCDQRLTKAVDFVFSTSLRQTEKRKKINPNTHFVPNGVDFDLFHQSMRHEIQLPQELVTLPKPIIGYTGIMGDHIDVDLLVTIASHFKEGSLVLVGPDHIPKSDAYHQLKAMTNVRFLGFKPLQSLPNYIKFFDVALIPYRLRGHVLSVYPQKLLEYLSGGKSVVATTIPALDAYGDVVRVASDYQEFLRCIVSALNEKTTEAMIQKRMNVAKENTWQARINTYYQIIDETLS